MKRAILLLLTVLLCLPMQLGAETNTKLQLTGSSTCAPLVSEIAKRYEVSHSKIRIEIQTGGSSRGIADALNGLADIGMSSRLLKPVEEAGRKVWPIAYDGVAFVVHQSNPVSELSKEQLKAIYTGQIKNWKVVGGKDQPITVISRAAGRSEYSQILEWFEIGANQLEADLIAGENQQGFKMVSGNKNAIIYISLGASEYEEALGTPVKRVTVSGIEASSKTVAEGSYPLVRPLLLITKEEPSEEIKKFIEYIQSEASQDLIKEFAYVSIPKR